MKPHNIVDKRNVQAYLQAQGCNVLRVTTRKTRAVIQINHPSPELQQNAAAFTETYDGQQRQVYFTRVRSCLVYWH